jgi:hypothetical protein
MTTAIFWRFLWKEYRVMRAFWISMACLAVLAQLSLVAFPALTHQAAAWTFSFALIFPALYAVACGATMFAAEKEEGTYEFLRGLPVTAWQVLSGKLAFALASTVLLIATLRFAGGLLMNGRVVDGETETRIWGVLGLAAIEGLAWGMFFSLVMRRPLQAAILGIAATSLVVHIVARTIAPWSQWDNLVPYLNAFWFRAGVAAIVLCADVLLLPRWLGTTRPVGRRLFRLRSRSRPAATTAEHFLSLPARRWTTFGRLAWQTWRQSWVMILTLSIIGALAALFSPLPEVVEGYLFRAGNARIAVISGAAALMGSFVFLADQEGRRLRYFGEQAVEFRAVWFAREAVWVAVLAVWALVVHGLWFRVEGGSDFLRAARDASQLHSWNDPTNLYLAHWYARLPPIGLSIYLTIGGFACGQLGSMFLRSGILAAFVGLVSTLILYGWALLMQLFEINWLWSLCPIPLVLLFATWLRTPDWILERNTWRGWIRVAAMLALPLAALVVVMALFRVYQIPDVSPGFSPDEYARAVKPTEAAQETAEMYIRAAYSVVQGKQRSDSDNRARPPDAADMQYLKANEEALALALKAARRAECSFRGRGEPNLFEKASALAHLLDVSARQLESEGKLDEAWDRWLVALRFESQIQDTPWSYSQLPFWAAGPGQSRERIAGAIKQLEQFESTLRTPIDEAKSNYLWARRLVTGGPDAIVDFRSEAVVAIRWSLLPWERFRALRLLNVCTNTDLQVLEGVRRAFASNTPVVKALPDSRITESLQRHEERAWLRTTILLQHFYSLGIENTGWNWAMDETTRRATHIIMAIEAWKLDHQGELPQHLSQLVGPYLDKLPLDPYSGEPFHYVRQGMALPAKLSGEGSASGWPLMPGKPFLWSVGEWVWIEIRPDGNVDARVAQGEALPNNPDEVSIQDGRGLAREPRNEYDAWLSGQWFEIP